MQWDANRTCEGNALTCASDPLKVIFKCHDGDDRTVFKIEVHQISVGFAQGDRVCAYFTATHKYMNLGVVNLQGNTESIVFFGDGDRRSISNVWMIHKIVLAI